MENRVYQIIKRPIITEKGLGVKETQHTVVFEVAKDATKTEIKEAVQRVFKVKVDHAGTRRRLSQRLEEGVRAAGRRRKDDRVRGKYLSKAKE
jgi:large subunit ribosomal protein L23